MLRLNRILLWKFPSKFQGSKSWWGKFPYFPQWWIRPWYEVKHTEQFKHVKPGHSRSIRPAGRRILGAAESRGERRFSLNSQRGSITGTVVGVGWMETGGKVATGAMRTMLEAGPEWE